MPSRVMTSEAPTIAASTSLPGNACASPTASEAGQVTVETWLTESECVSSKSSPWQSIAFANAALTAGSLRVVPDHRRLAFAADLGHRRPALGGGAGRVRGQAAAERVQQVELRVLRDLRGHVLERQRRCELGDPLCSGHLTPSNPSSVPGNVSCTSGASRL